MVVNPQIVESSDEREMGMEGCLSLGRARVHVEVERARDVVIEAQDVDGAPQRIEATGMHARILQHELDHLDGVLMLDRTSPEHRRAAVRALNAGEPWRPPGDEPEPAA